jgi:alpha-N-arabinofuranosidase
VSNGKINPLYFVAGDSEHDTTIVKLAVYNSTTPIPVNLKIESVEAGTAATLIMLTGPADPYQINDPFLRTNVVKETTTKLVAGEDGAFTFSLPHLSVAVLETEKKGGKGKGKGDEGKGKGKKARRVNM